MTDCIIIDLDGTLCDHSHRVHHVLKQPKDYKSFHDACVHDKLNKQVYKLHICMFSAGVPTVIVSGRPNTHARQTEVWLGNNMVMYHKLFMRMTNDTRADWLIKSEILEQIKNIGLNPILAIDDRPSVIRMWRENGIPTLEIFSDSWDGVERCVAKLLTGSDDDRKRWSCPKCGPNIDGPCVGP